MPKSKSTFEWHGRDVAERTHRAIGRASVAWGESIVSKAKGKVHRLSGTLSRSIHAAGKSYDGGRDKKAAEVGSLGSGGFGAGRSLPTWAGDRAFIEAGSWIDYAVYEQARGGSHDFMTAAVDSANSGYTDKLRQAMMQEGLF